MSHVTQRLRVIVPSLLLAALVGTGCVLTSGQFLVQVDLGDVTVNVVNATTLLDGYYVDLTTNGTWKDHKGDIKSIEDLALVGDIHNSGASSVTMSAYLLDGNPGPQPAGNVIATGIRVWGPITVAAGATEHVDWDRSSALFGADGKAALLDRVKGTGQFTLYGTANTAPFTFEIKNGVFIVVVGAAK